MERLLSHLDGRGVIPALAIQDTVRRIEDSPELPNTSSSREVSFLQAKPDLRKLPTRDPELSEKTLVESPRSFASTWVPDSKVCYPSKARTNLTSGMTKNLNEKNHPESLSTTDIDRSNLYRIQTPQVFPFGKLLEAFERFPEEDHPFTPTDDASIFAWAGHELTYVEGCPLNIKATTAQDLQTLEWLLTRKDLP